MLDQDATQLGQSMAEGHVSAEALMAATLDRIAEVNGQVNAIVSLRPVDALMAEARAADTASSRGGWLHGIPVAVKDLALTAGIPTTRGSPIFAKDVPDRDDGFVTRMKAAGAIVIGKTNVPQFGMGSHSTNPVFGVTRNPYDLSRTAGGSSGGAGAALAARMVSVADGSDMMGSLRNPAGWNNVYSLRPTWGVIPDDVEGDTHLHSLATNGPMARTPRDVAALLRTMATVDPRRPYGRGLPDLDTATPPKRIGWLGDWSGAYPMEQDILSLCETALGQMGCEIVPMEAPFDAAELWDSWCTLRQFAVAGRLGPLYADPELRAALNPQVTWELEQAAQLSLSQVQRASEIRSAWYARLVDLCEEVDALALPTAQMWPFPADWAWPEQIGDQKMDTYHRWMEVVIPVSLIGLPAVTLPAGFGQTGLPMGLQVFGAPGADGRLLALAERYHQATDWPGQKPPVL